MPVPTPLQKECTDAELDTLAIPCAGGADSPACVAALALLPAACQQCLSPFNHPFEQKAGLYACAAAAVNNQCRRAMGCAVDCAQTSCNQCSATTENQCYTLVNGGNGQCSAFAILANCANQVLAGGLCSQFSYANYGDWLRGVGDQFCGNGP
jgi:hypothetical protein